MDNNIVLFDGEERDTLLPLTYLRPTGHCRVGIQTIEDKWKHYIKGQISYLTPPYLSDLYPCDVEGDDTIYINGAFLPSEELLSAISSLDDEVLIFEESIVAFRVKGGQIHSIEDILSVIKDRQRSEVKAERIRYPEDILTLSRDAFLWDYQRLTRSNSSAQVDDSNRVRGTDLFVGKDVKMYDAIINTLDGPVYIDDQAEIMEGAVIKGPVYIGKGTKVHVGAKLYADTYLGPECRVGGEIKRTTMFGYDNKGHEGYLGDSVLGQWCNLGADTNNSNMKNTYGLVSLWDLSKGVNRITDRQFLGMILGDHTMSAINTSFNTGSVTGIFSNILDRAPHRYTPSFSWGKDSTYDVEKAVQVAKIAMGRRSVEMQPEYEFVIRYLNGLT